MFETCQNSWSNQARQAIKITLKKHKNLHQPNADKDPSHQKCLSAKSSIKNKLKQRTP
jgi:hypothetical protein